MSGAPDTSPATPARRRLAVIDIARGVAIVAMIIYHFAWDLGFTGIIALDVTQDTGWIWFQRSILSSFLFLTGISLVLAHGQAIRWQAFWRRFAMVGGAALLVSIGTYVFAPDTFVYFGILHAIALFSLMGLAFLRLPLAVTTLLALVALIVPVFVQSPLFANRALSWIGLWDVPPPSEDLVPALPWFGVTLLGIAAARWGRANGVFERLAAIKGDNLLGRALALAGRWSLPIYLVHQPIMLGALLLLSHGGVQAEVRRASDFTLSCEATCTQSGGQQTFCTAYCACALEEVATRDMWAALEAPVRSEEDEAVLQYLAEQCTVRVIDESLVVPQE